jgi:hypothetical protein
VDDTDRSVLDLESRFFEDAGLTAQRARMAALAQTPYYRRLARIVDDPQAATEYPDITARLRRLMARPAGETQQAS